MSQLKRAICLTLVISIFGLMTGVPLGAADPQAEKGKWDNVKKLNSGQEIKVVMNDAKSYRGRVENVSDEEIKVSLATGDATFARQDILRVSTKTGTHRLRNTGIGAGIGGGALAGIAAAKGDSSGDFGTGAVAVMGLILGSAIGAGVGAALPSEAWRDVYRAR